MRMMRRRRWRRRRGGRRCSARVWRRSCVIRIRSNGATGREWVWFERVLYRYGRRLRGAAFACFFDFDFDFRGRRCFFRRRRRCTPLHLRIRIRQFLYRRLRDLNGTQRRDSNGAPARRWSPRSPRLRHEPVLAVCEQAHGCRAQTAVDELPARRDRQREGVVEVLEHCGERGGDGGIGYVLVVVVVMVVVDEMGSEAGRSAEGIKFSGWAWRDRRAGGPL